LKISAHLSCTIYMLHNTYIAQYAQYIYCAIYILNGNC
jgi:hypothetical protein